MGKTGSIKDKYPKFIIFELTNNGPLVTHFETADEVAEFLWGKYLPRLALFVNAELYHLKGGNIDTVRRRLERASAKGKDD